MSSKSRKQSDKTRKKRPRGEHASTGGQTAAVVPAAPKEREGVLDIPDEILHAPKETSKLRFALMIGLVIFLLIIFIIPGALLGGARRTTADDPVVMAWEQPGVGRQTLTGSEFQTEHRALADAVRVDPFLGAMLGVTERQPSSRDAARIIVLDRIAAQAGIQVTDADLAEHLKLLRDFLYNRDSEALKASIQAYPSNVEETLRRGLRAQRLLQLTGYAGAVATPEAIEESWSAEHAEVAFDYVVADVADFEAAARAELPDDDELESWFDEKPDWERAALNDPERRAAQAAVFRSAGATPAAGLLAAYPPSEDPEVSADDRALEYYNSVFTRRFVKPAEDPEAESVATEFLSFEEVKAQCLVEAPVQAALQAWLTELSERQAAGEDIDFLAEATEFGLGFVEVEPQTRDELLEHGDLGDALVVNTIFATQPQGFGFSVVVTEDALAVVRATERVEATLPPFAEIRDEVADLWVEPRALELATEALAALFEGFEEFEPEDEEQTDPRLAQLDRTRRRATEEAFRAAVEAAGYEVRRRDWQDRGARERPNPDDEDPDAAFFQRNPQLGRMDEGELGEPLPGGERDRVYLVRLVGERPVPLERMSPRDYARYKSTARRQAQAEMSTVMDLEFLEANFGLELPGWDDDEEGAEEDAGDEAAEEASEPAE